MSTKRVKNNRLIGILGIVMMLGILLAVIFSSEFPISTRIIFGTILLLVGGLYSWSLLDRHFRKTLGREMRASPLVAGDSAVLEGLEQLSEKPRHTPPQPFHYRIFDSTSLPDSSPAGQTLIDRGFKHYRGYVSHLILGVLFLWVAISILGFVTDLLFKQSTFSFNLSCAFTLALVAAFFVANPRRFPTSFTILIWFGLNFVFLVPLIALTIANVFPLFTSTREWSSLLVFLFSGSTLIVYILLMVGTGALLRSQVSEHKPMRLLVLWVFNSATNLMSALSSIGLIWQFLGTIQFLRGGGLTVDMGELVRNKRAELVVDTVEELRSRLKRFTYAPNWAGMYPRNSLLCGDKVWKSAVCSFLRDADTVAMGLFGFSKSNQGCLYELGLLFDTFPLERVLFLVDETTDLDFLLVTLQENWDNMAADSPNQAATPVRIYRLRQRFDQPLDSAELVPVKESRRSESSGHPMLWLVRTFSAAQSALTREADGMLKLILEGLSG